MGVWGDYNLDGLLDLFVSKWGNQSDLLYRNAGGGTFSEVGGSAGLNDPGDGQGASWGDFDNDGDLDLFLTRYVGQPNMLFRNNGNGTFTDIAASMGVADGNYGNGVAVGDFNADNYLDIYVANEGTLNSSRLYQNNGGTSFTNVAPTLGLTGNNTRGVNWVDVDGDGDLDLFLANRNASNQLFINQLALNPNTYFRIIPLSGSGSWVEHGIRVVLKTTIGGSFFAVRTLDGGSSYGSQNALPIPFFALTPGTSYDAQVFWSDGTGSTHTLGVPDGSTRKICKGVGLC